MWSCLQSKLRMQWSDTVMCLENRVLRLKFNCWIVVVSNHISFAFFFGTHSGGVPSRSKSSNSSLTLSFSKAWKEKVHCLTCCSGLRKAGARNVPFFDAWFAVEINRWSQAAKFKQNYKKCCPIIVIQLVKIFKELRPDQFRSQTSLLSLD